MNVTGRILLLVSFLLTSSCGGPGREVQVEDSLPPVFPDYCGVTVPFSVAPLNFRINGSDRSLVVISGSESKITIRSKGKVKIPEKRWRRMLTESADDSLNVNVEARIEKKWTRFRPFSIHVKSDTVDQWIAYRLIAPGYESYSDMGIYQRDLHSFRQRSVITNRLPEGTCMNCHSFNSYNPGNMIFHIRGDISGTVLIDENDVKKLNTKVKETIANCIYPYWHPSGEYIAFSVNNISQVFHSVPDRRIEVFDSKSDIVVYDIADNTIVTDTIISSEASFETFPAFSPDGRSLFFCSASSASQPENYNKVKYSLCRIDFDPSTGSFGNTTDTLVSASSTNKSVSFPRVSPDGRFLLFTLSDYGNFSIWHSEADLYILDLESGIITPADPLNSPDTESYHSWSSNSRWAIFSSRRLDGLYTRPYIAYFSEEGTFSKPFMLPQKDPDLYELSLRSFNVPEFIKGKIKKDSRSLIKVIRSPAMDVKFEIRN